MSVSGIAAISISQVLLYPSSTHSNFQSFRKEFQRTGQDLSSGNLSQAQLCLSRGSCPSRCFHQHANNSAGRAANPTLSGYAIGESLCCARDYATVQKDFHQTSLSGYHLRHRLASLRDSSQNPINQLFALLGHALQSGNLSSAQTAYATLQQNFQSLGTLVATPRSTPSSTVSLSA